jgi:hypothetical protein
LIFVEPNRTYGALGSPRSNTFTSELNASTQQQRERENVSAPPPLPPRFLGETGRYVQHDGVTGYSGDEKNEEEELGADEFEDDYGDPAFRLRVESKIAGSRAI